MDLNPVQVRRSSPTGATLALAAITFAVVSQSPAPDQVILATSQRRARALEARFGSAAAVVADRSPLSAAVNLALGKSAHWIWLLDGRRVPQPGALAAFLEAAATWPDRRLRLLSSQLVDADGTLLTAEAPLPQALDPDLAVEAFAPHTCSFRVAVFGSLLVGADALRQATPPPNGAGADLVWSARLLAGGVGLLVPGSVAVSARPGSARQRLRLLAGWSRLLATDALAAREKPWVGFVYFERGVALIAEWARDRRSGAPRRGAPAR